MRTPCVCGGPPIIAASFEEAGVAICHHNGSSVHAAWRRAIEAADSYALALAGYHDDYPRRPTAGLQVRDLSERDGASAAEGAA